MKKTTAALTVIGSFLVLGLFATVHGSGYGGGYERGSRYEYRGNVPYYNNNRYEYRGNGRNYDNDRYEYRGNGRNYDDDRYEYRGR